jgi:hypothetical protein
MIMGSQGRWWLCEANGGRAPVERRYPVQSFLPACLAFHLQPPAERWLGLASLVRATPAATQLLTGQGILHGSRRLERSAADTAGWR